MRIYFDNCCLNRLYDDLTDNIVRMECEAILSIIDNCGKNGWMYFSSDVLLDEILKTTDNDRQEKVMLLYHAASEHIGFTETIFLRAKELEQYSIKSYDALHIASAETARADVFLTTDRKLINAAKRSGVHIPVQNPLIWLAEVFYDREP
jgi:predicted nucleic acid-binding protein